MCRSSACRTRADSAASRSTCWAPCSARSSGVISFAARHAFPECPRPDIGRGAAQRMPPWRGRPPNRAGRRPAEIGDQRLGIGKEFLHHPFHKSGPPRASRSASAPSSKAGKPEGGSADGWRSSATGAGSLELASGGAWARTASSRAAGGDRLGQAAVHPCLQAALPRLGRGIRRQRQDRHPPAAKGLQLVQLGRLDAVHHRHVHIHQHEVEACLLQRVESLLAVGDEGDAVASAFQDALHHPAVHACCRQQPGWTGCGPPGAAASAAGASAGAPRAEAKPIASATAAASASAGSSRTVIRRSAGEASQRGHRPPAGSPATPPAGSSRARVRATSSSVAPKAAAGASSTRGVPWRQGLQAGHGLRQRRGPVQTPPGGAATSPPAGKRDRCRTSGRRHGAESRASGSTQRKVLPRPGVLSTPISPPIPSTMRLQMARPSPVPP